LKGHDELHRDELHYVMNFRKVITLS